MSTSKEDSSSEASSSTAVRFQRVEADRASKLLEIDKRIDERKEQFAILEGKLRTVQRHMRVVYQNNHPDNWTEPSKLDYHNNERIAGEYEETLKALATCISIAETRATVERAVVNMNCDADKAALQGKKDVGDLMDVKGEPQGSPNEDGAKDDQAATSDDKDEDNKSHGGLVAGNQRGQKDDDDEEESDPSDIGPKDINGALVYADNLKVIRKKARDEARKAAREEEENLLRERLRRLTTTSRFAPEDDDLGDRNDHRGKEEAAPEETDIPKDSLLRILSGQLRLTEQLVNRSMEREDRDLPTFSGRAEEWLIFIQRYEESKSRMSEVKNLTRIQKALKGDAYNAVRSLFNSASNVDTIIQTLKVEFGRPDLVVEALIQAVERCKNSDPARPGTIIEFARSVQALVTSIRGQGASDYMNNVYLINKLVLKLPPSLKREWSLWVKRSKTPKSLTLFGEFIAAEKEIVCEFHQVKVNDTDQPVKRQPQGQFRAVVGATEAAQCHGCGKKGHSLSACWNFEKKTIKDRRELMRQKKICYCCLDPGHLAVNCKKQRTCGVDRCSAKHHRLLHSKNFGETSGSGKEPTMGINASLVGGSDGPQPIVPVLVRGPGGSMKAHALLDSGATGSLIRKELANSIGLVGPTESYTYCGVSGHKITELTSMKCNLEIKGRYRGATFSKLVGARTVGSLPLPPYSINMIEMKKRFSHLKHIPAVGLTEVIPDIIIGSNNPLLILARKIIKGKDLQPVAWRSKLGWVIAGGVDNSGGQASINMLYQPEESDEYLHRLIKSSFTTDNFGVKATGRRGNNLAEDRALKILEETTHQLEDGAWETGLLWKEDHAILPESQNMAFKRLQYTERKMNNPDFAKLYRDKISEYMDKKYIRKLTPSEVNETGEKVFYIPHFGVVNPNKPGKFRLVFDAAAKVNGKSLNDFLFTGPDLIRPLISVLINFRRHEIALTGDIADMFHRVKIRKEDKPAQRFLWRDGNINIKPDHYEMNVMIFGATCSPSSAIYVKNRNADGFMKKYPSAAQIIKDDFYVDDCLTGGETEAEVIELRKQVSLVNGAGGFQVVKFNSNNKAVLESIPKELRGEGSRTFNDKDKVQGERVLGLWWEPESDIFTFKVHMHKVKKDVLEGRTPTKRELCSLIMSLYDPLGFINHYKIKGVMLLQQTWTTGIGWDDEIPKSINDKWQIWLADLPKITEVEIPRCYSPLLSSADDIQLHTFVDASEEAFAAISYLRIKNKEVVNVSFVCSKVKVAPIKKLTIPRLELQAATLGSRIATMLRKELRVNINTRYFWSDSKTVLSWIYSTDKKHNEFVSNRIGEIQEDTNPHEWKWVPTKVNVADVATRFNSEISFNKNSEWYTGPAFLMEEESAWPGTALGEKAEESESVELIATQVGETPTSQIKDKLRVKFSEEEFLPHPGRFSTYNRLLCAAAAVKACANAWRNKTFNRESVNKDELYGTVSSNNKRIITRSPITPDQLIEAEKALIRYAQSADFDAEIKVLRKSKLDPAARAVLKKGKIWRLSPFIDDEGILRMDGRIGFADVGYEVKYPAILSGRHHITGLIIDQEHVRACHQGRGTVMVALMRRFAILGMKEAVKRRFRECQVCRIKTCRPVQPRMGPLPYFRLGGGQHPSFYYTGVDYFGPMEVVVGRRREKRWGVLFTCMVTRGIHLEIAHGLSTDEAIMALCRFISCRGRPHTILSDNGTNFVGAAHEFQLNWSKIVESANDNTNIKSIVWLFQPARSPHMGGAWERLVGSVKRCLKAILIEKTPKDTTLMTLLKEVENTVNSRPLTMVSTDPDDPIPITPNDIIRGRTDVGPSIPYDDQDENLKSAWRRTQHLADIFWKRWTAEFLPQLLKREKWEEKTENLEVGDLVFLVDDLQPRNTWRRGFVGRTFPGKDGEVRVVEVHIRDGGKVTTFRRAVNRVCPLGIRMDQPDTEKNIEQGPKRKQVPRRDAVQQRFKWGRGPKRNPIRRTTERLGPECPGVF